MYSEPTNVNIHAQHHAVGALLAILQEQIKFVRNSDVSVEVDRRFGWVTIKENMGEDPMSLFFESYQAEDFLDRVDALVARCPELTNEEAELAIAYDYLTMFD